MANLTMITSLVGSSPDGDYRNSLFYPFYLYSHNSHGTSLDVYTDCEKYTNEIFKDIPYLDVTASLNDSAKMIVVNVVNRHESKVIPANILLQAGEFTGNVIVNEVNGKSVTSTNTRTEEGVGIATKEIKFKGNTLNYSFPAHSLTQLQITLK